MTEAIHLRAAGPDDLERLLAFARDFHAEDSHPLTAAGEEALRRLLRDPALGAAFLVLRSGTPVGYAVLCFGYSIEWGGREAFIDDLHVAPAHRGAGLGEAAVRQIAEYARAHGVRALHLEVMPGNRVERLYGRNGFADRGSRLMTRLL